jgi:predicted phosphohydrolase
MLIRKYSDIHLESTAFEVPPLETDSDTTLILAGDLDAGIGVFKNKWPNIKKVVKSPWILTVARRFKYVIVVFGNHEYWGQSIGHAEDKARRLLGEMGVANVFILQNSSIVLDGVKFVGSTLWTDYDRANPLVMLDAEQTMNDFKHIRNERRQKITSANYFLAKHITARTYLLRELETPFDGVVVFVTHHGPSSRSYPDTRNRSEMGCYASSLESLMHHDNAPKWWFHGHIHTYVDYVEGGTRVIAVAIGYKMSDFPTTVYNTEVDNEPI